MKENTSNIMREENFISFVYKVENIKITRRAKASYRQWLVFFIRYLCREEEREVLQLIYDADEEVRGWLADYTDKWGKKWSACLCNTMRRRRRFNWHRLKVAKR